MQSEEVGMATWQILGGRTPSGIMVLVCSHSGRGSVLATHLPGRVEKRCSEHSSRLGTLIFLIGISECCPLLTRLLYSTWCLVNSPAVIVGAELISPCLCRHKERRHCLCFCSPSLEISHHRAISTDETIPIWTVCTLHSVLCLLCFSLKAESAPQGRCFQG